MPRVIFSCVPQLVRTRRCRALPAGATAVAAWGLLGCGGAGPTTLSRTPTAAATETPTSQPASVDPCVVGRWTSTVGSLPQTYNGAQITVIGGGDVVLSYNADGTYAGDFSRSKPYTARTADGHLVAVQATGAVAGTFATSGGMLSLVDSRTTLTVATSVDGRVTSTAAASRRSSANYVCSGGTSLVLTSGAFSTQYLPAP